MNKKQLIGQGLDAKFTRHLFFQLDTSSPSVSWLTETVLHGEVAVNRRGSHRSPALSSDIRHDHDSNQTLQPITSISLTTHIYPPALATERVREILRVHHFCILLL